MCFTVYIYAFQVYSFNISSLLGIDSTVHKTPSHIVLSPILCPLLSMHNGNISLRITPALFTHSNVRLCGG